MDDLGLFHSRLVIFIAALHTKVNALQGVVAELQTQANPDISREEAYEEQEELLRVLWEGTSKRSIADIAFVLGMKVDRETQFKAGPGVEFDAWLAKQISGDKPRQDMKPRDDESRPGDLHD